MFSIILSASSGVVHSGINFDSRREIFAHFCTFHCQPWTINVISSIQPIWSSSSCAPIYSWKRQMQSQYGHHDQHFHSLLLLLRLCRVLCHVYYWILANCPNHHHFLLSWLVWVAKDITHNIQSTLQWMQCVKFGKSVEAPCNCTVSTASSAHAVNTGGRCNCVH